MPEGAPYTSAIIERFSEDEAPSDRPRLLLVRHAPTAATRMHRFPADEPLDDDARAQARAALARIGSIDRVVCSPAIRARDTAATIGLDPPIDPRLAECNFGTWAGLAFDEVRLRYGPAVVQWFADPSAAPHGGESLREVAARVRSFMHDAAVLKGTTLAFTHGGVIRVAVTIASGRPLADVWNVTVEPLSTTALGFDGKTWRVET